jgi:hypothetical protein
MSIVFVKSQDRTAETGRSNPNKPYRFSNYFSQPLKLPPNSQVAYVGSTFNMNTNGRTQTEPYYLINGIAELNYPIAIYSEGETVESWAELLNNHADLVNQYGMDSDYVGIKSQRFAYQSIFQECNTAGACFTYGNTNKGSFEMVARAESSEVYNMDFNCCGSNPPLNFTAVGGGNYTQSGLNYNNEFIDSRYEGETTVLQESSPSLQTLGARNCGGFEVNQKTDDTTKILLLLGGGANYYNTGMSYCGMETSGYNYDWFNNPWNGTTFDRLPPFNEGAYAIVNATQTGIKRIIGMQEINNPDAQLNNGGGHDAMGDAPSGGYAIWTMSNLAHEEAVAHYGTDFNNTAVTGFTGLCAGTSVGVLPCAWVRGMDSDPQSALFKYTREVDLNNSTSPLIAEGAKARYVFGFDIYEDYSGGQGNADLKIQAKVLDYVLNENGSLDSSVYRDVGNALSITGLSLGINTAVFPPYEFDATHNHYINTYDAPSGAGNKNSMIFFRFRWTTPYQMAIEFTLQEEGKAGSYNPYTDEPYLPSSSPPPAVEVPNTPQDILLNDTTTGQTFNITTNTRFRDSGGDSDYQPDESYVATFVAPEGTTASFTLNSFTFEHSGAVMYDRLGIQGSDDGLSWTNLTLAGFQTSANTTPPYSSSFGGTLYNSSQSINGWILPRDPTIFTEIGGDPLAQVNTDYRYLRFWFISDGSAQRAGWDINFTAVSSVGGTESDPTDKWCLLASMDLDEQKHILIPAYFGDMGLYSYSAVGDPNYESTHFQHAIKGYFDLREANRYWRETANEGYASQFYTDPTQDYRFFNNGGMGGETLCFINEGDTDESTPKLKAVAYGNIETFDANGWINKVCKMLVNTFEKDDAGQTDLFKDVRGQPLFKKDEPQPLLEMGYILGLTKQGENKAVVLMAMKAGQVNEVQFINSANQIQTSSLAFSNHIQITNLPIQSQNGVVNSQNKTIYVINSLCVGKTQDGENYRFFCDTSPYPLWVDLNNVGEMNVNRLELLITDDKNTPQQLLMGDTDITLHFRQKPASENGTVPTNILTTPFNQPSY